jgi:hypothetical protein
MDAVTCPKCKSNKDYSNGFCTECGFDVVDDETVLNAMSDEDFDKLLAAYDTYKPPKQAGFSWATTKYEPEPPYQPFYDLVKSLEKWPLFRLNDTDHWGNRLISWVVRKTQKVDIAIYPKAFGPFVWMPKYQMGTKNGYRVLCHEGTHVKDFWKFGGPLFYLSQYVLPYGPCFTALWEYRAYVETMRADFKLYGSILKTDPQRYAEALASKPYRYAWPWPKLMTKWFEKAKAKIEATQANSPASTSP